jgi:hypothetical protein
MTGWPLTFSLPLDEVERVKLEEQIAGLEQARREALRGEPPSAPLPRPRVDPKTVWLTAGLAALGSLLGARQSPAILARTLADRQTRLDEEALRQERSRQQEWEWRSRQSQEEAAAIEREIARRARAAERLRDGIERKSEIGRREKLELAALDREDRKRQDDLAWKKAEADREQQRWESNLKRLEEAAKAKADADAASRSLAQERLSLDREKASASRAYQEARLELERQPKPTASRSSSAQGDRPGQPSTRFYEQREARALASRAKEVENLTRLKDQKEELVKALSGQKKTAETSRNTRYFTYRYRYWMDRNDKLNITTVPVPTASGKAALRRLQDLDTRIIGLRSQLQGAVEPFDPTRGPFDAAPPAWARGPIRLRPTGGGAPSSATAHPLPKPPARPMGATHSSTAATNAGKPRK